MRECHRFGGDRRVLRGLDHVHGDLANLDATLDMRPTMVDVALADIRQLLLTPQGRREGWNEDPSDGSGNHLGATIAGTDGTVDAAANKLAAGVNMVRAQVGTGVDVSRVVVLR